MFLWVWMQVCSVPVAAFGLLQLVYGALSLSSYYTEDRYTTNFHAFLAILRCIANGQPGMTSQVLDVLHAALSGMGSSKGVLAQQVLDLLIQLMMAGAVEQVLQLVKQWSTGADLSLVRYFVLKVRDVRARYSRPAVA